MPRMSLRDWLAIPNPHLILPDKLRPATHTTNRQEVDIDGWQAWTGFNMKEVDTLFRPILDKKYDFPNPPEPVPDALLVVSNEDALRTVVRDWNAKIVNQALLAVAKGTPTLLWATGGSCAPANDGLPDLSAPMSDTRTYVRTNHIAADAKMLAENFPVANVISKSRADPVQVKCIKQVLGYAADLDTRYAYLLGPCELIIIRAHALPDSSPPDAESVAHTRNRRPAPAPPSSPPTPTPMPRTPRAQHNAPNTTSSSGSWQNSPTTAPSRSSYQDTGTTRRIHNMARPHVAVIPWENTAREGLTTCLGMFALHFIGGVERHLGVEYPRLTQDGALRAAVAAAAAR